MPSSGHDTPASSFVSLYSDNHGWLQGWLRGRLGNAADAADLAQDVFLRLWVRPPPRAFQNPYEVRSYLCKMANGLCINLWHRRELERAWLEALAARPLDTAPSAEHQAVILQALHEVSRLLLGLPQKAATAFLLATACGMTDLEVAQQIGVSERMVRKYVAKAMLACMELKAATLE